MKQKSVCKVVYRSYSKDGPVPAIILQGKFLVPIGFPVGGYCEVAYYPKKIVITAKNSCESGKNAA